MREAAQVVSRTLGIVAEHIGPGKTGIELDKLAEDTYVTKELFLVSWVFMIFQIPFVYLQMPKLYTAYKQQALSRRRHRSVDCGAILNGYYGDHAYTFMIGEVKQKQKTA